MKTKTKVALAVLTLGASVLIIIAQDTGAQGPPGPGQRRKPAIPLVITALDANHDGVVDAAEIANASAALKTLDKNGDGKLTMDELMGTPPQPRTGGPGDGPGPGNNPPPGPPSPNK
jgi:hypothetical protein